MADGFLNQFVAVGTAALRAGFTPVPPAVEIGPDHGYFFFEKDTRRLYTWEPDEEAWVLLVGVSAVVVLASEALAARDAVNIYNDSGVAMVRKADPDQPDQECDGFVIANTGLGDPAVIVWDGPLDGFVGLTEGVLHYLDGPGTISDTAAGTEFRQEIGKTTSGTTLLVRIREALPTP